MRINVVNGKRQTLETIDIRVEGNGGDYNVSDYISDLHSNGFFNGFTRDEFISEVESYQFEEAESCAICNWLSNEELNYLVNLYYGKEK